MDHKGQPRQQGNKRGRGEINKLSPLKVAHVDYSISGCVSCGGNSGIEGNDEEFDVCKTNGVCMGNIGDTAKRSMSLHGFRTGRTAGHIRGRWVTLVIRRMENVMW